MPAGLRAVVRRGRDGAPSAAGTAPSAAGTETSAAGMTTHRLGSGGPLVLRCGCLALSAGVGMSSGESAKGERIAAASSRLETVDGRALARYVRWMRRTSCTASVSASTRGAARSRDDPVGLGRPSVPRDRSSSRRRTSCQDELEDPGADDEADKEVATSRTGRSSIGVSDGQRGNVRRPTGPPGRGDPCARPNREHQPRATPTELDGDDTRSCDRVERWPAPPGTLGSAMIDFTPNPIALQLGPLTVFWYGIGYAVGLAVAYLVIGSEARRRRPRHRDLVNGLHRRGDRRPLGGRALPRHRPVATSTWPGPDQGLPAAVHGARRLRRDHPRHPRSFLYTPLEARRSGVADISRPACSPSRPSLAGATSSTRSCTGRRRTCRGASHRVRASDRGLSVLDPYPFATIAFQPLFLYESISGLFGSVLFLLFLGSPATAPACTLASSSRRVLHGTGWTRFFPRIPAIPTTGPSSGSRPPRSSR